MKKTAFIFLFFVFACLVLIFLDRQDFLRPIKKTGENLILPLQESLYSFRLKLFSAKTPQDECQQELKKVSQELLFIKSQISSLEQENQAMRRLLGAFLPSSWQFWPAKVIGEEYGVLKIDKGKKDEVKKGQTVVLAGVFVGKVFQLGESFSLVQTPRAVDFRIQAVVRREEEVDILGRGILIGSGEKLFLERLLQEEEVRQGDIVLTAGGDGLAPNIPIGEIVEVVPDKGLVFKRARIEPFLEDKLLETVFLVKER